MRTAAAIVVAMALASGACGGGGGGGGAGHTHEEAASTAPAFPKAEADTAVDVILQDYAFVGVPDTVTGPNLYVAATIKGSNTHELVIFDEGQQVVEDLRPFERPAQKTLAVVLEPGTYSMQCLIEEGSRTHADLGMRKTFVVSS